MRKVTPPSASALLILLLLSSNLFASEVAVPQPAAPGLQIPDPIMQSRALQRFQNRPLSELSKLLYLVDRLGETDVQIVYEKNTYYSKLVLPVARWYVSQHYDKKDSAEDWLSKWCYRSLGSGEPVWVKYKDGSLRSARDLLLEELDQLDSICDGSSQP